MIFMAALIFAALTLARALAFTTAQIMLLRVSNLRQRAYYVVSLSAISALVAYAREFIFEVFAHSLDVQ